MGSNKKKTRRKVDTPAVELPPVQAARLGSAPYVELSPRLRLWSEFRVDIRVPDYHAALSARVGKYGRAKCFAFSLTLNDGTKLDYRRLRKIPLDIWLSAGERQLLEVRDEATGRWLAPGVMSPSALRDRLFKDPELSTRVDGGPGSRRPLTRERLEVVASIFNAHATSGKPIAALEQAFPGYSRAAINKWVKRARDAELIEPARRTTKGARNA